MFMALEVLSVKAQVSHQARRGPVPNRFAKECQALP
jgi:hypothetical protein